MPSPHFGPPSHPHLLSPPTRPIQLQPASSWIFTPLNSGCSGLASTAVDAGRYGAGVKGRGEHLSTCVHLLRPAGENSKTSAQIKSAHIRNVKWSASWGGYGVCVCGEGGVSVSAEQEASARFSLRKLRLKLTW
ncbi:hypothetical protein FQA47_019952 [Oryzias melastigma]|uniref:Uncharacterized protein n=1 Tax=Oryzias melastigma TaxID=30732 RepID=A0A834KYF5_ORYME|nr:hypothetical protein FQA47_019952 [Oryzias melastigma]